MSHSRDLRGLGQPRDDARAAQAPSGGSGRTIFLLALFLVSALNYGDRVIMAALLPLMQSDLGFSDGQAGLLTGLAFAAVYALCGLPLARWADRGNRRDLIVFATAFWSIATALCGVAATFAQLFLARMGVGMGEAGSTPASHSLICDYFPPAKRSSALAVQQAGTSVGTIGGLVGASALGALYGWRVAFIAVGLLGVLLAIAVRLLLREPERNSADLLAQSENYNGWQAIRLLLSDRAIVQLVFAFGAIAFCAYGFGQWAPSFYFRYHDASVGRVGALYGLFYGTGAFVGMIAGGLIGDRLLKRGPDKPLRFCSAAFLLAIPAALGFLLAADLWLSIACTFVMAVLTGVSTGPIFAMIYALAAPRTRAVATAITMFVVAILGVGLGPTFVGVLSDLLAIPTGSESLRMALVATTAALAWPAFHLWSAARLISRRPDLPILSSV